MPSGARSQHIWCDQRRRSDVPRSVEDVFRWLQATFYIHGVFDRILEAYGGPYHLGSHLEHDQGRAPLAKNKETEEKWGTIRYEIIRDEWS